MKEKHEGHLLGSVFYTFSTVYVEAKPVRKTTATQRISTQRCLEQCLWSLLSHTGFSSALTCLRLYTGFLAMTHLLSDMRKSAAHLQYKGI